MQRKQHARFKVISVINYTQTHNVELCVCVCVRREQGHLREQWPFGTLDY